MEATVALDICVMARDLARLCVCASVAEPGPTAKVAVDGVPALMEGERPDSCTAVVKAPPGCPPWVGLARPSGNDYGMGWD